MQRNWLRTNDIDVDQDFADILRELGLDAPQEIDNSGESDNSDLWD